jgi:hypothetical protein
MCLLSLLERRSTPLLLPHTRCSLFHSRLLPPLLLRVSVACAW